MDTIQGASHGQAERDRRMEGTRGRWRYLASGVSPHFQEGMRTAEHKDQGRCSMEKETSPEGKDNRGASAGDGDLREQGEYLNGKLGGAYKNKMGGGPFSRVHSQVEQTSFAAITATTQSKLRWS